MDVAHAALPFCSVSSQGSIVLAGDHLQLPPIHKAQPPAGLEDMVGSIYEYWRSRYSVSENALDVNYRSNDTLVGFAREAGYRSTLTSQSPSLRLQLTAALPSAQPANWPPVLYWSPEWSQMLDPGQPAVCFVYDDGRSSQRNDFEADAVAAIAAILNHLGQPTDVPTFAAAQPPPLLRCMDDDDATHCVVLDPEYLHE